VKGQLRTCARKKKECQKPVEKSTSRLLGVLVLSPTYVAREHVGLLKLIECPRCKQENPLGTVYCRRCGYA